jgi:hypothetical protein
MRRNVPSLLLVGLALALLAGVGLFTQSARAQFPTTQAAPPAQSTWPQASGPSSGVQTAPAPKAPFVTLYDQLNNPGTQSTLSQDFEPSLAAFSSQIADDFNVPVGQTWQVNEVDAQGVYFNGNPPPGGPAVSFNVFFYTSVVSGSYAIPGPAVYTATGQSYVNTAGVFAITLSAPATLPGGATNYFVSAQARMDYGAPTAGEWGWTNRTVQANSPAAFRNPGGALAPGCVNWDRRDFCTGSVAGATDQMFRLVGNILGGATATPTSTGVAATPTRTATVTATVCASGSQPVNEGFESGLGAFTNVVATCVPGGCGWNAVTTDKHSGLQSAFAPDPANISDQYLQLTNGFAIPANATSAVLTFWHRVATESTFDGGVLEFSTDGGTTWSTTNPTFLTGGYNGTIS